ncbi:hypothetical protein EW146_g6046 [Bondarzewia mesenterica]|uniref:Aminoglycoside phosphotransferase domain-containing protein n=1 Tax=Bondarzewia mesenterica TaxID=1095465 RepID=A0A4S4LPR6_9AGAM|nr:hypothetical protein EW146_g6046 [Bondarzewia mesenterica]
MSESGPSSTTSGHRILMARLRHEVRSHVPDFSSSSNPEMTFISQLFRLDVDIVGGGKHLRAIISEQHRTTCGPLGGADEADTIRFIRKHTTIPVPRVLLSARGYGSQFMLMRYVDGVNLESAWRRLDDDQRAHVVRQLRSTVMRLRSLQPTHSNPLAICGLNNAACKDGRVSSNPFGPFADESGFNDHLIHAAEVYMDPTALSEIRARMRDDHRVMFTHGDLAPRNIIVREDEILAVIDWEHAGWYPEHWELVKALYAPMVEKDTSWTRAVREVMPLDYETEWHVDRELSDNMVGGF